MEPDDDWLQAAEFANDPAPDRPPWDAPVNGLPPELARRANEAGEEPPALRCAGSYRP